MIEEEEEPMTIHTAHTIINNDTYIYDENVLKIVSKDDIVRIYMTTTNDDTWKHDSPYLKVLDKKNNSLLCFVLDINRKNTNMYPLDAGERIWIKLENIIEIPLDLQPNPEVYKPFLTDKTVNVTGPLYTIVYPDFESDSSDSDDD